MLPHPQPRVPLLKDVPRGGQTGVMVQEPSKAVVTSEATFDGPRILVHAPQYEWHSEA